MLICHIDESQLIAHTFRSGESEQGVLIANPQMLVCPKSDLYQYDVEASLIQQRRAFKSELETCHALTNQAPAKPKNDRFHSLGVFCFTTQAELVEEKQNKS